MPKNGRVAEPGLSGVAPGSGVIRMPPVSVCHHVSTIGQRPSPTTCHDTTPGFRIDRLADACPAGAARRARSWLGTGPFAFAHQRADRGWRGVEDVDLVLVADLPEARKIRVVRHAFEHQRRRAVGQRAVDDVAVTGDPAHVGRAPVDVAVVIVEQRIDASSTRKPYSRRSCAIRPWACRSNPTCRG